MTRKRKPICVRKKRFSSFPDEKAALAGLAEMKQRDILAPYKCSACGKYHLTYRVNRKAIWEMRQEEKMKRVMASRIRKRRALIIAVIQQLEKMERKTEGVKYFL